MGHEYINLMEAEPYAENIYYSIFFLFLPVNFTSNRYNNNICLPHDKRINGADWFCIVSATLSNSEPSVNHLCLIPRLLISNLHVYSDRNFAMLFLQHEKQIHAS